MNDVDRLTAQLRTELSKAREDLGLPAIDFDTPEAMLAEADRLSEVVATRMKTIESQLGTLETTRTAALGYLAGEATRAVS